MNKLLKVAGTPSDELKAIVRNKTGPRKVLLTTMQPDVIARYADFEVAFDGGTLATFATKSYEKDEEEALLHCYNVSTAALAGLKQRINESQPINYRAVCQYCTIGPPKQFDHYLPKGKFPDLSVHPLNLLPCCSSCNGLKSEVWLDGGARAFLNLYFDPLPKTPFVMPSLTWSVKAGLLVPAIHFTLVQPPGYSNDAFALASRHFKRLNLVERYKEIAHSEFMVIKDAAVAFKGRRASTLRRFVSDWIKERSISLGPLDWRLALYSEIIQHRPFLKSCLVP